MLINLITGWQWPGERPVSYGWYHLMWVGIMIVATILLVKFVATKHDKRKDNIVIFSFGLFLVLIEIYKQIFYFLDAGYYQWHAFPFQFCSVPMLVAFIAPLLKEGKVKEALYKFIAFFGLLAGLAVMTYPGNCFGTDYVVILIHTMIWHSSMVIMGVYLLVSRGYGKNYIKDIIPGFIVFAIIVAIAFIGNIVGYKLYFSNPELNVHGQSLNMFYISPYDTCSLPILSVIQTKVPYVVFFMCYLLAFLIGISILWSATRGVIAIKAAITNAKQKAKDKEMVDNIEKAE